MGRSCSQESDPMDPGIHLASISSIGTTEQNDLPSRSRPGEIHQQPRSQSVLIILSPLPEEIKVRNGQAESLDQSHKGMGPQTNQKIRISSNEENGQDDIEPWHMTMMDAQLYSFHVLKLRPKSFLDLHPYMRWGDDFSPQLVCRVLVSDSVSRSSSPPPPPGECNLTRKVLTKVQETCAT